MLRTRIAAGLVSVGVMMGSGVASGQGFPNKPIRIVTGGAGGGDDATARVIAPALSSGALGQQVIVENRPSGVIPGEVASKAAPDGYTLLLGGGTFWVQPLLRSAPYDPVRDFSPITLTTLSVSVLAVHPSLPVKSVKDLIALAKARPGALNYAAGQQGSTNFLATELFKSMAGVNIVYVSYKSGSLLMTDLMGGHVEMAIQDASTMMPLHKAGKLRALGATSAQPSALAPGLPTISASGLPGYQSVGITGIFAPAKTPEAVIKRLNQELVRALNSADVKQKFFDSGSEVVASSPEELAATVKSEIARLGKLIKDIGLRLD